MTLGCFFFSEIDDTVLAYCWLFGFTSSVGSLMLVFCHKHSSKMHCFWRWDYQSDTEMDNRDNIWLKDLSQQIQYFCLIIMKKQQQQPFYGYLDFVQDNLGESVPEETFTHSHLSWSSIILYVLHLLQSMASSCSVYVPDSLFAQPLSKSSLVYIHLTILVSACSSASIYTYTHTHTTILWPSWILSGTTQVIWHQKGKIRKVQPIWIYWSKR